MSRTVLLKHFLCSFPIWRFYRLYSPVYIPVILYYSYWHISWSDATATNSTINLTTILYRHSFLSSLYISDFLVYPGFRYFDPFLVIFNFWFFISSFHQVVLYMFCFNLRRLLELDLYCFLNVFHITIFFHAVFYFII